MGKQEIIEAIKQMNVMDLADLVKDLEEIFGVSGSVVMAPQGAMAPTAVAEAAPPEEEKTEFTVVLKDYGANKINVIKVVRELTGLGLKEAKDLVEGAPKAVKEVVPKQEAETAAEKLRSAGATVDIT